MNNQILNGPGYSAVLPTGFTIINSNPFMGYYWLAPPGSQIHDLPTMVQIRPVQAMEIPMLLQNLYQFENPMVAMANATNLGLAQVTTIRPIRQMPLNESTGHIRDFDAITMRNYPARVMVLVIQGLVGAVEVVIMVNLYRWVEFIGPCLEFVGGINLSGLAPTLGKVQAVIDENHQDQVEYQILNQNKTATPITSMPTQVGPQVIINIDNSIKVGNINGSEIVVGHHSLAGAKSDKPPES